MCVFVSIVCVYTHTHTHTHTEIHYIHYIYIYIHILHICIMYVPAFSSEKGRKNERARKVEENKGIKEGS